MGGGNYPQPGEISLAHNGVLFLDELPEFKRTVLEVMRQPLEDRNITISRAKFSVEYPASFMLVASMNPCPCGYYNHPTKDCVCGPGVVQKYLNKISGPLLDRIDIHLEVVPVPFKKLSEMESSENSEAVRQRVLKARKIQEERFEEHKGIYANAQMSSKLIRKYVVLDEAGNELIKNAMERLGLSARAYDRILKVATYHCRFGRRRKCAGTPSFRSNSLPQFGPGELGRVKKIGSWRSQQIDSPTG